VRFRFFAPVLFAETLTFTTKSMYIGPFSLQNIIIIDEKAC